MVRWARWAHLLIAVFLLQPATPALGFMSSARKRELRELTRETWRHAYGSYKRAAFPADELLPLSCRPQGHDRVRRDNTGVNDVMGDYLLTTVDSMDTFPILGDREGWENAVRETIQHVSFDRDSRVQVFEVTIRMLGGLLSAHIIATDHLEFSLPWYRGELLALARDLGRRLLPAFNTPTGIPYPRVHLQHGVVAGETVETCTAGAGSLLLEFGTLSRLTGDAVFENVARKAFYAVWNRRSELNLLGNTISAFDGRWLHAVSSTGAGIDSFFEYAAKAYVMFGEDEWWRVWEEAYSAIISRIRAPDGFWYRGANMHSGQLSSVVVDSLSAFFPGVQTLVGDVESAIKAHAVYAFQWKRYGGLPELFDINRRQAVSLGYPLRPEFIESNLYLYQATKDEWYLEIAEQVLSDINNRTRVACGLAAVLDLNTGALEDKQPSFVTSETLKYLYLTFDEDSPFNSDDSATVFSTEGHMLSVDSRPVLGRRRRSIPAEAPTCPAYDPELFEQSQHFLSLGVSRRTDIEYARFLAGYVVEDEPKEIAEGRWSESGWCELPVSEDYAVEILFAAGGEAEDLAPAASKVGQTADGSVIIHGISGLRFSLTRAWPGGDDYLISRVGPYRIPPSRFVTIDDPVVLASIPASRINKVELSMVVETATGESTLKGLAYAAAFGPSIASNGAASGSFAVSLPPLPLVSSPSPYGCDVHHGSSPSLDGKVVILRRGGCSFAKKANVAALAGAKGVLVVGTLDDEDVVPLADEEEASYKALVPLVLVSNSTGSALEAMMKEEGGATIKAEAAKDEDVNALVLGGYTVVNVKLLRQR